MLNSKQMSRDDNGARRRARMGREQRSGKGIMNPNDFTPDEDVTDILPRSEFRRVGFKITLDRDEAATLHRQAERDGVATTELIARLVREGMALRREHLAAPN